MTLRLLCCHVGHFLLLKGCNDLSLPGCISKIGHRTHADIETLQPLSSFGDRFLCGYTSCRSLSCFGDGCAFSSASLTLLIGDFCSWNLHRSRGGKCQTEPYGFSWYLSIYPSMYFFSSVTIPSDTLTLPHQAGPVYTASPPCG